MHLHPPVRIQPSALRYLHGLLGLHAEVRPRDRIGCRDEKNFYRSRTKILRLITRLRGRRVRLGGLNGHGRGGVCLERAGVSGTVKGADFERMGAGCHG